jgi:hypothetical protein
MFSKKTAKNLIWVSIISLALVGCSAGVNKIRMVTLLP